MEQKKRKLFGRLYYYLKKNNKDVHIDESDALILSLGFLLLLFGVNAFVSSLYDSFFAKYLFIPNIAIFAISIFSIYFLLVMKLEKGSRKSILLMYIFPVIFFVTFAFYLLKIDLSQANNGLSLVALSLTFLFMPIDKLKEKSKEKIKAIDELSFVQKEKIRDEMIDHLRDHNKNLLGIIDDLLTRQEGYSDKIEKSISELKRFDQKIDSIKEEVNNSKKSDA